MKRGQREYLARRYEIKKEFLRLYYRGEKIPSPSEESKRAWKQFLVERRKVERRDPDQHLNAKQFLRRKE